MSRPHQATREASEKLYDRGLISQINPIGSTTDDSTSNMISTTKQKKVIDLIEGICATLNINKDGSSMSKIEMSDRADDWATEGTDILTDGGDDVLEASMFDEVTAYFKQHEEKETKVETKREFEKIETFVKEEKYNGRKRREVARLLAASEEVRVSAEVAELKAYRLVDSNSAGDTKLQEKIADAEKSHANRKMVISKAARLATSDCRKQFKRVRDFFQCLHDDRRQKLRMQYERSLKIQSVLHRLKDTDPRVRSLESQTAERIFRKKESDMTELNMVQNLEEATYLEKIITLLDDVQEAKEVAADRYFKMQIKNLKHQQKQNKAREKEITDQKAKSMLEMAELIAKYVKEEMQDREDDEGTKQMVEKTERRKDFEGSNAKVLLSVSDLYDTILWSVATGSIGISSSDSGSFDSLDYESDDEEEVQASNSKRTDFNNDKLGDDELGGVEGNNENMTMKQQANRSGVAIVDDSASAQSGSTANTTDSDTNLSPVGHIFVKELRRSIRKKEKMMEKRFKLERKAERKKYRAEARSLKESHQGIVDGLLAKCVDERQRMRDAIARRMASVERQQNYSTQTLQEAIDADVKAMQQAWGDHKRLEEEQKTIFAKAQALISAQVFHEVRNALSSVVAMSEMTSSLQKDPSVDNGTLVASVSEMLDQNKEVVNYSLNMLNNILDVSKIKAGSFETKEGFFDLNDLVNRATTMQLVKAQTRGVKMSFAPMRGPQIAYADEDIVARIITNFISNAVKFTTCGAVQPFVCPLESLDPSASKMKPKSVRIEPKKKKSAKKGSKSMKKKKAEADMKMKANEDSHVYADVKYMAVGVADTGPGLSRELLNIAEAGLFNSDASKMNSGAKNSGFGLHLAHQLAGTLGSEVNLTDLDSFQKFYNVDMADVLNCDSSSVHDSVSENGSVYSDEGPGKGSVLYITIPVVSDRSKAISMLESPTGGQQAIHGSSREYVFSPKPAPNSVDGCFRILVADDVAMLRKGLMRSVLDIFKQVSSCPISVSTACTAEDALRAVKSNAYDIFICDNQFASPTHLKRFPPELEKSRIMVNSRGETGDVRKRVMQFFKNESFTIAPGDGSMSGVDALLRLAERPDPDISIPILVLHSGHQLELPQQLGIIIVRKPLKRDDFVPMFERNAENLIETGMCVEVQRGDSVVVLNRGGAQLFTKRKCLEYTSSSSTDEVANESSAQAVRKRTSSFAAHGKGKSPEKKKQKSAKPAPKK